MTPDTRLLRVAALHDFVDRLPASLEALGRSDSSVGDRLEVRLRDSAGPLAARLLGMIRGEPVAAASGGEGTASPDGLEAEGNALVADVLAYLAADAARRLGLDDGLTLVVEQWLDALSARLGIPDVAVVIPASAEFTGLDSRVVRLKLPMHGTWGLPVALHEYGHFVASVLTRRERVDDLFTTVVPGEALLLTAGAEIPQNQAHGHELFADAFAASVAGPAYVHYCMRYRFDADVAHEVTNTHPSLSRRVHLQLDVLDALAAEHDPGAFLTAGAGALRAQWQERLAAAGTAVDPPGAPEVDQLAAGILDFVLADDVLRRVRYRNHGCAHTLAERGLADRPAPPSVWHLLNAAWLRRESVESRGLPVPATAAQVKGIDEAVRGLLTGVPAHA